MFIRRILLSLFCAVMSLCVFGQMSEDAILRYVSDRQSKGASQEQIVMELGRRGVTPQQLQRMRDKYSRQQSSSVFGSTSELEDDPSRVRSAGRAFNRVGGSDISDGVSQSMYDESAFLFADSSLLSVRPSDISRGVSIYGHDLFSSRDLTFAPSSNLATPSNYRLGPGDEVIIDIWGASQTTVREVISPDGNIMVRDLGPVYLNGRTVREADSYIKKVFSQIYSGLSGDDANSSIKLTLGQNRSIQVNVMGEVSVPGTYQLSSFATVFNALYMAGGVSDIGSLRDIRLYRGGKEIAVVDMYEYIMHGRVSDEIRLEDNDAVVVSAHSVLVNIEGRVRRPMYYEMKSGETLSTLVDYAGGLSSDAYRKDFRVVRMGTYQREIFTVPESGMSVFSLVDGDYVYVDSIRDSYSNMAEVRGAVNRAGRFQIGGSITTLRDLVEVAGGLKDDAFPSRALLSRTNPDKTLTNLSVDIKGVIEGSVSDVTLRNDDVLFVPSVLEIGEVKTFGIYGEVLFPGVYRYADNTSIEDLILQAGGLKEDASLSKVDVVRRTRDKDALVKSDSLSVTYSFSISEDLSIRDDGFRLMPYDEVYIRRSPGYAVNRRVMVEGEVLFPGYYSLATNSERLSDIMSRVGEFSSEAYPAGARLERVITADERSRMLSTAEVLASNDSVVLSRAIEKLETATSYTVGIDLGEAVRHPGGSSDIVLRDGDRIIIPMFNNTVKIDGEVMFANTAPYVKGKSLGYYIDKAGGYSQKAKRSKVYIVYMNGSVAKGHRHSSRQVQPGCEIVVPARKDREGLKATEVLSLGSTSASLATVVLALMNLLK
jgi:protein involved in polysaccharide export with SLBB domain